MLASGFPIGVIEINDLDADFPQENPLIVELGDYGNRKSAIKSSQGCWRAAATSPDSNSGSENRSIASPQRIALTGFMGAGKTTLGLRLAQELGWDFVDLDEEIVRSQQNSIAAIFERLGEARFRELEHASLAHAMQRNSMVLALGGGALETAVNRQLLTADSGTLLLYLEAPLEVLIARCEQQASLQPHSPRRPVLEKRAELTSRFLRRKPLYELAHWTIGTAGLGPEEVVQAILQQIQRNENAAK